MAKSRKKKIADMLPPARLAHMLGEEYPRAWKDAEDIRAQHHGTWPEWCYLPVAKALDLVVDWDAGESLEALIASGDAWKPAALAALAAWRRTKGVYRFDPTLAEELMAMPLGEELPCDVFYRLPEWCVYIELPPGGDNYGFFAHLDYDIDMDAVELHLLFLGRDMVARPIPLIFAPTLAQSFAALRASLARTTPEGELSTEDELRVAHTYVLSAPVQLVLYLCATNADMPDIPKPREQKREGTGGKVLPLGKPRVWEVGARIGAAIRRAREGGEAAVGQPRDGERQPPRPHIRRAHYHHYWAGPGRKTLVLRWIAPVFVGDTEDAPVVVRRVE